MEEKQDVLNFQQTTLPLRVSVKTVKPPVFQTGDADSNPATRITIDIVKGDNEREMFNRIVKYHHGYKQSATYCGRQLNFFIRNEGRQIVGAIGFGSHCLPEPIAFKHYIGWGKEQYNANFNKVANNWRFTLLQRGLGSKVLSVCHKEVPKYWKQVYGDKLVLLTTMIGEGYKGTCYKAAGWEFIGKTKGYGGKRLVKQTGKIGKTKQERGNMFEFEEANEARAKLIFVKPLHRHWNKELLRIDSCKSLL